MNKILFVILLGILLGEMIFLLGFGAGEDFWAHYLVGRFLLGWLSPTELQLQWPYPFGYDQLLPETVLVLPFALLSPQFALLLWTLLIFIGQLLAFRLLMRSWELAVAASCWPPCFVAIWMGQMTPILLLAWGISEFILSKKGRSGLIMSLAMVKPHLTPPLFVPRLFRHHRRWVLGLALGLLPWIISLPLSPLIPLSGRTEGFFTRWFLANPLSVSLPSQLYCLDWKAQLAISLVGLSAVFALWWHYQRDELLLVGFLFFFPHIRVYDLPILAPTLPILASSRLGMIAIATISLGALLSLEFLWPWVNTIGLGLAFVSLVQTRDTTWKLPIRIKRGFV